jgi:hypothetical protein
MIEDETEQPHVVLMEQHVLYIFIDYRGRH